MTDNADEASKEYPVQRRDVIKAGAGAALLGGATSQSARAQSESTATGPTVYVGSDNNTLYAVDAVTGDQEWAFTDPSGRVQSSPTVVNGTVYVGAADKTLYAVDGVTGDQEWAFDTGAEVNSSPTVINGTVYVGSKGETLFAVDTTTGTQEWAFTEPSDLNFSSPTVWDETVYVGSDDDETLYAVDAVTGEQEWAFTDPSGWVQSSPTVWDGTVYVGSGDKTVYAVDAVTGDQEWAFTDPSGRVPSSPSVVNGTVYVGSRGGMLYAVDSATGTEEWSFTEPSDDVWSSPTIWDGTVYIGAADNTLYAVDSATGTEEWAFTEPSDGVRTSPTVWDGTVYIGSWDHTLYAVDTITGDQEWAFPDPYMIISSPTVVEDPANGDSVGSRVNLGTLGHHHGWDGTDPGDPWTVEGFEDGSLDDWDNVDTAEITSSRAYAGQKSLEITDQQDDGVGNKIHLSVVPSSPSRVGAALLIDDGSWNSVIYNLIDSDGKSIHNLRIHHRKNSTTKDIYYGGNDDVMLRSNVSSYKWYYIELVDIQWSNNLIGEIRVNNVVEATDVAFLNNSDTVSKVTLFVHDGGTGSKGYFDDLSIGTPQSPSKIKIEQTRTKTETLQSPVTVQVTDPDPRDPANDGYEYRWEIIDSPAGSDPRLLHGESDQEAPWTDNTEEKAHAALRPDTEGDYTLEVEVTDSDGNVVGTNTTTIDVDKKDPDDIVSGISIGADSVAELAEMYAPVIHFHGDEEYFPTRYEAYAENAELQINGGDETIEAGGVSLLDLGDESLDPDYDPTDQDNRLHLIGNEDDFRGAENSWQGEGYQGEYPRTVYASVTDTTVPSDSDLNPKESGDKDYIALTYWMFYLFDPKSDDGLSKFKALATKHASDTETITILIDGNGPQWVGAAQHYSGEYMEWEKVADTGGQPDLDIYPAKGAHSSFLVETEQDKFSSVLGGDGIPAQWRWLPFADGLGVIRLPNLAPVGRVIGDVTDSKTIWSHDGGSGKEQYDLLVLPESGANEEKWTEFAGVFTSVPGATWTEGGKMPWQRDSRWENPGVWIEDRMLPEWDVLDHQLFAPSPLPPAFDRGGINREAIALRIPSWTNPGKKPHEFVVHWRVTATGWNSPETGTKKLPLGWNESERIDIPLDTLGLPSDGNVSVTVLVYTYDPAVPAVSDTKDLVYTAHRETEVQLLNIGLNSEGMASSTTAAMDTVSPGDEVSSSITVENTGSEEHTYFLSLRMKDQDGDFYQPDDIVGKPVTLSAGEQQTVELTWTVDDDIPEAEYDLITEGWAESDPEELLNRLTVETEESAFTVTKPTGDLDVTATPEDASITVDGEYVDETPVTTELPVGTYEVVATSETYASIQQTATIADSETTNLSFDLTDPAPAVFELARFDAPTQVEPGEEFTISAVVQNPGDESDTQQIEHRIDGTDEQTAKRTLQGQTSSTEVFTHTEAEPGVYEHELRSEDDEVSTSVVVIPEFGVGDVTESGDIGLTEAILIQEHVAGLEPEPFNEELGDLTRSGSVGLSDAILIQEYVAGLADAGTVEISNLDAQDSGGNTLTVTADLDNPGDLGALQRLDVRVTEQGGDLDVGTTAAFEVADIGPGGTETVDVAVDVSGVPGDTYEYGVFSDDDQETGTITVN